MESFTEQYKEHKKRKTDKFIKRWLYSRIIWVWNVGIQNKKLKPNLMFKNEIFEKDKRLQKTNTNYEMMTPGKTYRCILSHNIVFLTAEVVIL